MEEKVFIYPQCIFAINFAIVSPSKRVCQVHHLFINIYISFEMLDWKAFKVFALPKKTN